MKISYNWLREYIDFDLDPVKTAEILTDIGLEVEGIEQFESVRGGLEGVVIGEVKRAVPHPDADKLILTSVDIGQPELLQIVCGAPNVREGQKVPVALAGTTLYMGEEEIKIKKTKIRGEFSEGMICAEDELGLGTNHEGIMVLDEKIPVGTSARDYFEVYTDVVYDIGLTPNRIDGASHYGAARDLAAFLAFHQTASLHKPDVSDFKPQNRDYPVEVIIENKEACPRYTGVTISGVEVKESPMWLQNRLRSIGLHPINNIVDITNFILFETGQPLHAFDADRIKGKKVIVRTLDEGSLFITLDEVQRELSSEDLMICNEEEGMCIAGVFGGLDSGVTTRTKHLFLESAYFDPGSIRKTAKRFGLNTDASFRFERGTDPEMTIYALKRASLLISEIAGGKISSDIVDVYPRIFDPPSVRIYYKNIERLIGKRLEPEVVKPILTLLEIKILEETNDGLLLQVPLYRVDVTREADVIEEILRIYGYNNIEIRDEVKSTLSYFNKPDKEKVCNMIADLLSHNGFNEIMVNSLTPSSYYKERRDYPLERSVMLHNPLSSDLNSLRQSMVFGGLETISYNINRKNPDLKLYEFGNCYFFDKTASRNEPLTPYTENEHLALYITGRKQEQTWNAQEEQTSFYYLKSFVENILERLGLNSNKLDMEKADAELFSDGVTYSMNGDPVVDLGIISRTFLSQFEIEQDVFFADFHWNTVLKMIEHYKITYAELPKFPEVKRDLALLLDKNIQYKQVKEVALQTEKQILKKVSLFDVFEDEKIGKEKKSYAVSFILQDEKRTLTEKQIEQVMSRLIKAFETKLGAKIR